MGIHGNRDPPIPPAEAQHEDGGGGSHRNSPTCMRVSRSAHTHTWPAEVTTWSLKPS